MPTNPTLDIDLRNSSNSGNFHAYVTGRAIDRNNALFMLNRDGRTPYYPNSPGGPLSPLEQDIAIPLGAPGNVTRITIPRIAGARVYFSDGPKLSFFINPGPALVEPSVTNPSDPNINLKWGFMELTFNQYELFANISYVDFVAIPVSLTLKTASGRTAHVSGINENGFRQICDALRAQNGRDRAGWDRLVYQHNGQDLRALSPNLGISLNPGLFENYYRPYTAAVWQKYSGQDIRIDTQAQWGVVSGRVTGGQLRLGSQSFEQPSARDIFSCSTGPFAENGSIERGALIARISAAFNRSTLLLTENHPGGVPVDQYYRDNITNHFSRIVHEANLDRRGYAFPYDDVAPGGGVDQSGAVSAGDPTLLTVAIGGIGATP